MSYQLGWARREGGKEGGKEGGREEGNVVMTSSLGVAYQTDCTCK